MINGGSCCDLISFGICSATTAAVRATTITTTNATIATTETKIYYQCQIETFAYTIHYLILY